jgi:hypothetical protein
MIQHSLGKTGLSLSQATSVSNLANQRAIEIDRQIESINNYSKSIKYNGEDKNIVAGVRIPDNIIDLIKEKSLLHACQAFLMENIKAKESLLNEAKTVKIDVSQIEQPEYPELVSFDQLKQKEVSEDFGWSQLSKSEYNKYLEATAFASHIGQFIHKKSKLDTLRYELSTIPTIEWMEIKKDEKIPVDIYIHHTSEELLALHNQLAELHREYEKTVNYYKAKVKNLTTQENARIAKENATLHADIKKENDLKLAEYNVAYTKYQGDIQQLKTEYEIVRQDKIKEISAYRIEVDPRFQSVIDVFIKRDDNLEY